jgi:hypothetical protein
MNATTTKTAKVSKDAKAKRATETQRHRGILGLDSLCLCGSCQWMSLNAEAY